MTTSTKFLRSTTYSTHASKRTYALAILMATVLVGCSEKPKIDLNCYLALIDSEPSTYDNNDTFVFTIDTSKKEFLVESNVEHPISYTEYDNKLVSVKTFFDWEARVKKQKSLIAKAYAEGESEHDADSDYWKSYFDSRKEKINNGFDEYYIATFNKITGELIDNDFQIDGRTDYTYACSVIERVMK